VQHHSARLFRAIVLAGISVAPAACNRNTQIPGGPDLGAPVADLATADLANPDLANVDLAESPPCAPLDPRPDGAMQGAIACDASVCRPCMLEGFCYPCFI
jgi:hypothetical protein